jgi:signal transduction histidine kinase
LIRAFLKLYLLVIIPLLVIAFIPGTPVRWLIDDMQQSILAEQYKGTFFLFEKELENLPQSDWPEHIEKLSKEFAQELKLEKIDEIDIRNSQRRKLLEEGLLYSSENTPAYWYRIQDSDFAIYNGLEDSDEELFQRDAQGTTFLARKWIGNYDDPRQGLEALRKEFGFPLKIVHENELELNEAKKEKLRNGRIIGVELNGSEDLYYLAFGANDLIIKAGPVSNHNLEHRVMATWASFPALLLAIAVLLWSIPFWRDLLRVKKSAFALGKGDFESRVKLTKGSALFDLGNSFNAMAKQIKQLIDGHKELTNAVSHELKTPVARLRFAHEMLQEQPGKADQKRYLANIDRDLGELESLIDELLTHARYDRADYPIYPDNHALKSWLDLLLLEFSDLYPKLSFSLSIDSGIETAWIDKRAMSRAIRNLLSNAARYARSKVQISVTHDLESLDFHVDDDGHGISETDRLKVFEPFVRLDNSRQRKSGGTGLGLAIVKRIVGRHGGSVLCEKSDLGGARFTVSLTTLVLLQGDK